MKQRKVVSLTRKSWSPVHFGARLLADLNWSALEGWRIAMANDLLSVLRTKPP
ncbi:hypothetical protein Plhal710r2_c010g0045601 [Plasmopara halstedii]